MSSHDVTLFADSLGWTEGPVVRVGHHGVVVVSIDRGHLYETDGTNTTLVAVTGGGPNGAVEGADGSIYVAQDGGGNGRSLRSPGVSGGVQVLRPDGRVLTLTSDLISPNDLCFGPDGFLYVTDPTRPRQRHDGRLWRVHPGTGAAELLVSLGWYPNGIGFGLEPDALYVADSNGPGVVRFPLIDGVLGEPETVVEIEDGRPDGFCFDVEGNLIVGMIGLEAGDLGGINTYSPDGQLLDRFEPGPHQKYTNCALDERHRLFITDSEGGAILLVEDWPTVGLPLYPFRTGVA